MYAVIKTGGKQYRVAQGEYLRVEKLEGNEGDSIELNDVLMIADGDKRRCFLSMPYLMAIRVTGDIVQFLSIETTFLLYFNRSNFLEEAMISSLSCFCRAPTNACRSRRYPLNQDNCFCQSQN